MAIRVGIGSWSYAPWRGTFYPPGLKQADELRFASQCLTAIEINATFYRTQSPENFARWAAETPAGFVFALKAPRAATAPADPDKAGTAVDRFFASGMIELGPKLGPVLWQFPANRRFDPIAMKRFLGRLPAKLGDRPLSHVIEALHPSFSDPAWLALLGRFGMARAIVEREPQPPADLTADFVYARLQRNDAAAPEGYEASALDAWAKHLRAWADGAGVDRPSMSPPGRSEARNCFVFFISGDKQRAPDAARALLARLA